MLPEENGRAERIQSLRRDLWVGSLSFPRGGKLSARNEPTDEGLAELVDFSLVSDKKPPNPSSVNGFAVATFPPRGKVSESTIFC